MLDFRQGRDGIVEHSVMNANETTHHPLAMSVETETRVTMFTG